MGFKTICSVCNKHKKLLNNGKCEDCTVIPVNQAISEMKKKKGKIYQKHKASLQEINRQVKNKKGYYYDRWLEGYRKGINKEIEKYNKAIGGSQGRSKSKKMAVVKPSIQVQCPVCYAYNKQRAKKCIICGVKFR